MRSMITDTEMTRSDPAVTAPSQSMMPCPSSVWTNFLPSDLAMAVVRFLRPTDILLLARTSQVWLRISSSERWWKHTWRDLFSELPPPTAAQVEEVQRTRTLQPHAIMQPHPTGKSPASPVDSLLTRVPKHSHMQVAQDLFHESKVCT